MAMAAAAGFLAAEDAWPFARYPPTPPPAHPRRLRQGSFVSLCLTRNEQAESNVKTRALETHKDAAPGTTRPLSIDMLTSPVCTRPVAFSNKSTFLLVRRPLGTIVAGSTISDSLSCQRLAVGISESELESVPKTSFFVPGSGCGDRFRDGRA